MNKRQVQIVVGLAAAFAFAYLVVKKKEIEDWARRTYYDAKTSYHLQSLHPLVRKRFSDFISEVEKSGYKILITSSIRSFERQRQIAEAEGKKFNSQNISQHNFGFAIDLNAYHESGKHLHSKSSNAEWRPIVDIAKKYNINWGGNWTTSDKVHFEIVHKRASELLADYEKGKIDKSGYVLV
jgi:hypothetical protein